jgi:hypothetical protein
MTRTRAATPGWLCLLCSLFCSGAFAEPLTSGPAALPGAAAAADADVEPRRTGTADGPKFNAPAAVDRSAMTGDLPSTSKTVELLLEMQGKNPGLEAGERPKAQIPPARPATATGLPAKPAFGADAASPFGGSEVLRAKPATGDPQAVDWSEAPPSRFGGVGLSTLGGGAGPREPYQPGAAPARSSDEDDMLWLIPRKFMRFVRENRDAVVLSSIGLLLVLWGISAFASSRRK